ncbi:MAG TPA: peptide-methionine (S)-S-oxide reductase MsrA [Vicinamibacteria bacterium]|nr:peptide-methionine (S)-S-oxide reductase MsrA [Vicinamibacteria bacterium]
MTKTALGVVLALAALLGGAVLISIGDTSAQAPVSSPAASPGGPSPSTPNAPAARAKATFAGGCFWCMEGPFDTIPGVVSTTSGYIGGGVKNPTYEQVSAGITGHAEAVEIVYDPGKVTYQQLLDVFWRNVDPTDGGGQFCDRGTQYRTGIFFHGEEQRVLAERSRQALQAGKKKDAIVTQIVPATAFYPAEEYHQDYYTKNPLRYKFYRLNCGRDQRLRDLWGDSAAH